MKSGTQQRNNQSNHIGAQSKRVNNDGSSHSDKHHRSHDSSRLNQLPSKSDLLQEHVTTLQNTTTKATIRAVNPPQLNREPGIVDGYLENVRDLNKKQIEFQY